MPPTALPTESVNQRPIAGYGAPLPPARGATAVHLAAVRLRAVAGKGRSGPRMSPLYLAALTSAGATADGEAARTGDFFSLSAGGFLRFPGDGSGGLAI